MAMNREQRRAGQKAGQLNDDGTVRQRERAAAPRQRQRVGVGQFVREVRSELNKVAWPSREELTRYSIVVLIAVVALTAMVAALDWGFLKATQQWLFDDGVGDAVSGAAALLG